MFAQPFDRIQLSYKYVWLVVRSLGRKGGHMKYLEARASHKTKAAGINGIVIALKLIGVVCAELYGALD